MPACRICDNTELTDVLDLGEQAISAVFPKTRSERVKSMPLKLVRCTGGPDTCGLLQLAHPLGRHDPSELRYVGEDRARDSAAAHENARVYAILQRLGRLGTAPRGSAPVSRRRESLKLSSGPCRAVAVDSPGDCGRIVIASPSELSRQLSPVKFLTGLKDFLDERDILVLEERYMPCMLRSNSYDSLRHEQVAYYALKQIKWLTQSVGLKIVDIEFNGNGAGTLVIALARHQSHREEPAGVETVLDREAQEGLHTVDPYRSFADRVSAGIALLRTFLDKARDAGKSISALGASKSGNVVLQSCRVTRADIDVVGEIESAKIGAFTPGTTLPIVPEAEVLTRKPDFLIVLPWKLRSAFIAKSALSGCSLLFPLPHLEVIYVRR
jgi:NDP-4-keto-2,6-dideoxyhexose 3-C-methyltransferase